jgi:hypothetical protein
VAIVVTSSAFRLGRLHAVKRGEMSKYVIFACSKHYSISIL